jgi:hypothetical protein
MRILLAMLTIAIMAGAALADDTSTGTGAGTGLGGGHKGRGSQNTQQPADPKKQKAIDDAYKSAITRIPDPKEKYDPWKSAR